MGWLVGKEPLGPLITSPSVLEDASAVASSLRSSLWSEPESAIDISCNYVDVSVTASVSVSSASAS